MRHESLEALENRLAQWRMAQLSGPGWMRSSAGKIIADLKDEIAARRKGGEGDAEG